METSKIVSADPAGVKLYLKDKFADVNFLFKMDDGEVQTVPAHKMILAVVSPVFEAMFYGLYEEEGDVIIKDANINTFKKFLQLFYLDKMTFSLEESVDIYTLANKYDVVNRLKVYAAQIPRLLNIDNVCWAYHLAILLEDISLKQWCENIIIGCPMEVFQSTAFLHCDLNVLYHILQLESMQCKEFEVFDACIAWAQTACKQNEIDENECENLREQLTSECLSLIRFPAMTSNEFANHSVLYKEMFSKEELVDILYSTSVKDYKSTKFTQQPRSNAVFEWSPGEALVCSQYDAKKVDIQFKADHFSFSTSLPLLLGGIYFHLVNKDYPSSSFSLATNVTISEQSLEQCSGGKNIFSTRIGHYADDKYTGRTDFTQPILINPRKQYQITWTASESNAQYHRFCATGWPDEIDLDEDVNIKIHQKGKMLSHLVFNRLFNNPKKMK